MTAGVQKHVGQCVPHFPRRTQDARVESLGEHPAEAAERPVERAREAGADGHHPTCERPRVGRLDEQMRVRGLEAVVDEAEVTAVAGGREAALEGTDEVHRTQRR